MKATSKIRQSPKLPAEMRREQLLRAAHRCFREQGYRGTSTEEIARSASLTKGALYFHFKSKEEILFALIKMMVEDFREAFATLPFGHIEPVQVIQLAMDTRNRWHCHDFKSMVEIWGQAIRITRIRRFLNDAYRKQIKFIAAGLDPAYGFTPKEAEQVAVMILSMCDGLVVRRSLDETEIDVRLQTQLMRGLFDLIKAGQPLGKKKTLRKPA
jgi:AcrR family transcriptional regulator